MNTREIEAEALAAMSPAERAEFDAAEAELDRYTDFATSGAVDDLADPEVIRSAQR